MAGPGYEPDDIVLKKKLQGWWKQHRDSSKEWRDEAEEDFDFYAGEQWSQEDKATLEEGQRPIITFNRIGPIIESICGMEVSNRQGVRYIPREGGDNWVNANFTAVVEWVRDECDAEDEETEAFKDMTICGIGCTETRMAYEEDPDGLIKIERVDPLESGWDPSARRKNLLDRSWDFRTVDMPFATAEEMWPDFMADDLDATWANDLENSKGHDAEKAPLYINDQSRNEDTDTVRIIHFQWYETEKVYRVADPESGQSVFLEPSKYNKLKERLETFGVPLKGVKQTRRKYHYAFIGDVVLETGEMETEFTRKFMTAKRDRNEGRWYGIVRAMKDPQRWANKWLSQILHIVNSNAKGGIMAEKTAFDNPRKAEDSWAQPDAITWLKQGGIDKIKEKAAITFPSGLDKMMEFAVGSIRDVSGVNLELLGMANRQQSGVLEAHRKQAGITILAALFDSLRKYRKDNGRLLIDFIQNYLTEGRLVRIMGENGNPQYVPFMKSDEVQKYDMIVDEAPNSPNQKEKTWGHIMEMMPLLQSQPMSPEIWQEVIKNSPMPQAMSAKIVEAMQNFQPPPDPKIEFEKAKLDMEMQKTAGQLEAKQTEMQLKRRGEMEKMVGDQQISEAELQHDMKLKEIELQHDMKMKEIELEHEMALENQKAGVESQVAEFKIGLEAKEAEFEHDMKMKESEVAGREVEAAMQKYDDRISGVIEGSVEALDKSIKTLGKSVEDLIEDANAPVSVVRDKSGKATGIKKGKRTKHIQRENGKVVGASS